MALIGPRFSFKMLTALVPREEEVAVALQHLLAVGLIRSDGSPPDAVYTFRHALLQDGRRQPAALPTRIPAHPDSAHTRERVSADSFAEPELIAWHYSSAGLGARRRLVAVGRQARNATLGNIEAIDHLRKGLELLNTLPDNPERDRRELDLQTHPGRVDGGQRLCSARERRLRACAIALWHLEDPSQIFPVLRGLWVYHLVRAEWRQAQIFPRTNA